MKKLFLIPLMALMCSVMAFATVRTAGTFAELQSALNAADDGDEIQLTADIDYGYSQSAGAINITKSITLNGQGHTLTGASSRPDGQTSQWATIWVNPTSMVDATIRNINIVNAYSGTSTYIFAIQTRQNINSLTIENAVLDIRNGGRGNSAPFQMGGSDTNLANITINNCEFFCKNSDYPFLTWVPANIVANGSKFHGYCGMYFKSGSEGSVLTADACDFDAPNVHSYSGGWNNFGVFVTEDSNITINLHNCGMNSEETGFAKQGMILAKRPGCLVNISGDNSHINGKMVLADDDDPGYWLAFLLLTGGNISITGGTYSVDPSHFGPYNPFTSFGDQEPTLPNEDFYANFVPSTHEVQEVQQGDVTLYRVVKAVAKDGSGDPLYDLNDAVETAADGENPVTSFELSSGATMELDEDREVTTAGYVQVKDNESTSAATTVKVGTTSTSDPTQKVDQTLIVNNGLDVEGNSQVVVQAGSSLVIGEGGITTESPANIVLGADEDGGASLLLHPDITVNQTPELTVKMTAKQVGLSGGEYWWHRFAMPVASISTLPHTPNIGTAIYGWDYENQDWYALSNLNQLVPFAGYTLTVNNEGLTDVEYTFAGNLTGNINTALAFTHQGYNFFGNSYTGYIKVSYLATEILGNADIDGSVWMWNPATQGYAAVPLQGLKDAEDGGYAPALFANWQREIAPMQTFIFRLPNTTSATAEVDYAATIWSNPRYGNASPAPARVNSNFEGAIVRLSVADANGNSDEMLFMEKDAYSDAYERGYDATKYMNSNSINMYTMQNGEKLSSVATDNLSGKAFDIDTKAAISYTLTINAVLGDAEYAIKDIVTNSIVTLTNGNTYTFTAQPNSTVAGRFVFVPIQNMPTDVETVEAVSNVRGIYSITGQYVGEDFDILPAGVYVVDGVKIVK